MIRADGSKGQTAPKKKRQRSDSIPGEINEQGSRSDPSTKHEQNDVEVPQPARIQPRTSNLHRPDSKRLRHDAQRQLATHEELATRIPDPFQGHDPRAVSFFSDRTDGCSETDVVNACRKLNTDIETFALEILNLVDETPVVSFGTRNEQFEKDDLVQMEDVRSAIGKALHDMISSSSSSDSDPDGDHLHDAFQSWIVFNVCQAVNSMLLGAKLSSIDEASRFFAEIWGLVDERGTPDF